MPRSTALRVGAAAALAAGTSSVPRRILAQAAPLRFAASPASTQAEAFYADKLGFFRQAGITATETLVTRGADAVNGVVDGDFDIGCSTPPSIANAIIHNLPIRIIAPGPVYVNPAPFGLYVAKTSPVRRAQDLLNTIIATQTLNDDGTLGILAWLDQNHVDTTKVKFIELTFPSMAPALMRGEVAAAFIVEPFASAHKDDIREIPGVYDSLGTHWAYGAWFAKKAFIDANPAVAKAIAGALYATAKQVNAHPNDIAPLLAQYSKISLEDARALVKPVWAERPERSELRAANAALGEVQAATATRLLPRADGTERLMLMETLHRKKATDFPQELLDLFQLYVHHEIDRNAFLAGAAKFAVGDVTASDLLAMLKPNYALALQVPENDPRIAAGEATVPSPEGTGSIKGYLVKPAAANGKLPAVLVVHENRGLNPYIKDVARRLAIEGYLAFARGFADLGRRISRRRREGWRVVREPQSRQDDRGLRCGSGLARRPFGRRQRRCHWILLRRRRRKHDRGPHADAFGCGPLLRAERRRRPTWRRSRPRSSRITLSSTRASPRSGPRTTAR